MLGRSLSFSRQKQIPEWDLLTQVCSRSRQTPASPTLAPLIALAPCSERASPVAHEQRMHRPGMFASGCAFGRAL